MSAKITIEISDGLAALAEGFAKYHQQSPKEYVVEALLSHVQADCEAAHHESLPEFQSAGTKKD